MGGKPRPKPCNRCGVRPKVAGQGKRYCEECDAFMKQTALEKLRTRNRESIAAARLAAGRPRARNSNAPSGTKWCNRCAQFMSLRLFAKNKGKAGDLSSYCRSCSRSANHEMRMKRVYGITHDQYFALLEKQGGVCAICHIKPRTRSLAVDHDHRTGLVRGLLCTRCNSHILATVRDSTEILRRAIDYLESPPARGVADDPIPTKD